MILRIHNSERGFSLIELTVVLLLITLLASVAVRETSELGFQTRYEQTRERLDMIKQAILGNPRQIINGQQAVSGFVADMGRLPMSVRELIDISAGSTGYCGDKTYVDQATCEGNSSVWFSFCSNSTFTDQQACETNNALWRGRKSFGFCSDALYQNNQTQCLANGKQWAHLFYGGWNGPYLLVSENPAKPDALTDGWGNQAMAATDQSYGWSFFQLDLLTGNTQDSGNLIMQSFGKNQQKDNAIPANTDYENDFPPNLNSFGTVYFPNPAVLRQDWLVDISGGVNVNFKKSTEKLPPISLCTDPTKTTKTACVAVGATWDGGCENAGYFNKSSCIGAWSNCSDGTSITKSACELAGKDWYGEGFGCSDQAKSNKALCTSPSIWRSCTDNGTITSQNACLNAGQIWYGENIFSIDIPSTTPICMKIFYRKPDATIGILISDEDLTNDASTVHLDPKSIIADASFQTIRFTNFRDSSSTSLITDIPIGTNAIGVYQHDGTTCTNTHYPADRQNPIQIDFHPHTTLPVINW